MGIMPQWHLGDSNSIRNVVKPRILEPERAFAIQIAPKMVGWLKSVPTETENRKFRSMYRESIGQVSIATIPEQNSAVTMACHRFGR
jgi:hypothetical protein